MKDKYERRDPFSPEERTAIMRSVKSFDTSPERAVRKVLHTAGFRFRINDTRKPGKPDLVFPRYRLAILVNGCFWHWHGCKRSRMPSTNRNYWEAKISRNCERDRDNIARLIESGWQVEIIWECELQSGIDRVLQLL